MAVGRPPRPTALKIIEGSRESRINRREPLPRSTLPVAPEDLIPDVKEVWEHTVRELRAMGLAHASDRDTLLAYCWAVVLHRWASKVVAEEGLFQGGQTGRVKNPAVAMLRDAANTVRVLGGEFGLTPSSRSRITANEEKATDDNPFAGTGS